MKWTVHVIALLALLAGAGAGQGVYAYAESSVDIPRPELLAQLDVGEAAAGPELDAGAAATPAPGIATSPASSPPSAAAAPAIPDPVDDTAGFVDEAKEAFQSGAWLQVLLLGFVAAMVTIKRWVPTLNVAIVAIAGTAATALYAALQDGQAPTVALGVNALAAAALLYYRNNPAPPAASEVLEQLGQALVRVHGGPVRIEIDGLGRATVTPLSPVSMPLPGGA